MKYYTTWAILFAGAAGILSAFPQYAGRILLSVVCVALALDLLRHAFPFKPEDRKSEQPPAEAPAKPEPQAEERRATRIPAKQPAERVRFREDDDEAREPLAGKKILIAEDNPVNLAYIEEILTQMGAEIMFAPNGEAAITCIRKERFDLVLMDCQMPVMDGYETTRRIRLMQEEAGIPHFPIVAITANAMKGDREKCLEAGMDDYLAKPVRIKTLKEAVLYWTREGAAETTAFEPQRNKYELMKKEDAPLLGTEELEEIRAIMKGRFEDVLHQYLESVQILVNSIGISVKNDDVEKITFIAHDIKSSSRQFGALKLACIARDLEYKMKMIADGREAFDKKELAATVDEIETVFRQTAAAFNMKEAVNC